MEIDYAALMNLMLISSIQAESPQVAKMLNVFAKKGINAIEAIAMLMEISAIAAEMQEGEDTE